MVETVYQFIGGIILAGGIIADFFLLARLRNQPMESPDHIDWIRSTPWTWREAGMVMFVSGTINFGIFPAVGARFFKYFCGLKNIPYTLCPETTINLFSKSFTLGPLEIDLMYAMIMIILLGISLFFTFMGGQIAVIITDFLQGSVFNILLCIVIAFVFIKVPWSYFLEALSTRPEGESMIHPFNAGGTETFNFWYYIIGSIGIFYGMRAWQGNQGYFASARNAHEARMGAMLGSWRNLTQQLLILIVPITAFVVMRHPDFSGIAAKATEILNGVADGTIKTLDAKDIRKAVTGGTSATIAKKLLSDDGIAKRHSIAMPESQAAQIATGETFSKLAASPPRTLDPKSFEKI